MSEHAPDRLWAGIDIPKTIAGVLAAVSAAVVGSFLGVAGTLVGAAVASIVGSVGTEIYHRSIERGKQRLQSTFVTAPAAVGTPTVVAAEEESPSEPEPPVVRRQYRWGRVAMVAGALFVLAMGVLSAFELTTGKSAADAVGGKSSSGTTIGSVLPGHKKSSVTPATTPTATATPTSDSSGEPSASPSSATSTEPSADPSITTATTSPDPATTDAATTPPAAVDGDTGDQGTTQDGGGAGGGTSADPTDGTGGSGGGVGTDSVRGSADAPQPDNSGE